MSVVVRDANGRVLAGRAYNDEFLRSGKVDEFSADLGGCRGSASRTASSSVVPGIRDDPAGEGRSV